MAAKHLLLIQELSDGVFLSEDREDFGVHVEDVGLTLLCRSPSGSLDGHLRATSARERFHQPGYPDLTCLPARNPLQVQTPLGRRGHLHRHCGGQQAEARQHLQHPGAGLEAQS